MKKIVIIFAFVILTLIILLSCSKIIESNSTACVILDLVFPETTTTDRDQIEVVTLRVSDNDTYDETFELEIENNIASGSIELEYGIYNFYVEAGFFEGEIFHLLYFGNVSNIDISESNNHVDIILVDAIAPTAGFSGTPTSGSAPLTVQFTDLSTPGSSSITEWLWDFGDGSTSTSQNPSHIFTSNGNYTIELTVTTTVGSNTEETTNYINVTSNPIGPTADFSGTPTSGLAPLTVQFTDLSTAGTSPITDWLWVFGDGNTSTSQNPSHIYTTGGDYSVALNVTTSIGSDSEAKTNYINVQQGSYINVTSPNGGEDWALGSTNEILWNSLNIGNNVKIELYRNNSLYQTITQNSYNDGSFNWTISPTYDESDYYKIKITSVSYPGIYDLSDSYFSLSYAFNGPVEELCYDNGEYTGGYVNSGGSMGTRMSPEGLCRILQLSFYTITGSASSFNAEIWGWDGVPTEELLLQETVTANPNGFANIWIEDLDIIVSSDFVVSFGSINTSAELSYDAYFNNGRSWIYNDGVWDSWDEAFIIRALVQYPNGNIVELEPNHVKNNNRILKKSDNSSKDLIDHNINQPLDIDTINKNRDSNKF